MRRLLAVGLAAAACAIATPANASCQGTDRLGACVTVVECARICRVHVVVDPYCVQGHPATLHCTLINRVVVDSDDLPAR